ncbi:MAG: hypothetical protein V1809_00705 [Planctomycetota bacterium]
MRIHKFASKVTDSVTVYVEDAFEEDGGPWFVVLEQEKSHPTYANIGIGYLGVEHFQKNPCGFWIAKREFHGGEDPDDITEKIMRVKGCFDEGKGFVSELTGFFKMSLSQRFSCPKESDVGRCEVSDGRFFESCQRLIEFVPPPGVKEQVETNIMRNKGVVGGRGGVEEAKGFIGIPDLPKESCLQTEKMFGEVRVSWNERCDLRQRVLRGGEIHFHNSESYVVVFEAKPESGVARNIQRKGFIQERSTTRIVGSEEAMEVFIQQPEGFQFRRRGGVVQKRFHQLQKSTRVSHAVKAAGEVHAHTQEQEE